MYWNDVLCIDTNVNDSFNTYFNKIESILNTMAPIRKLTKRERRLQQRPWITKGILKSMKTRDKLHKKASQSTDPVEKQHIFNRFKKYRNLIACFYNIILIQLFYFDYLLSE